MMKRNIYLFVSVVLFFTGCVNTNHLKVSDHYNQNINTIKKVSVVLLDKDIITNNMSIPFEYDFEKDFMPDFTDFRPGFRYFQNQGNAFSRIWEDKHNLLQNNFNQLDILNELNNLYTISLNKIGIQTSTNVSDFFRKVFNNYKMLSPKLGNPARLDISQLYSGVDAHYVLEVSNIEFLFYNHPYHEQLTSLNVFGIMKARLINLKTQEATRVYESITMFPEEYPGLLFEKLLSSKEYSKDVIRYTLQRLTEQTIQKIFKTTQSNRYFNYRYDDEEASLSLDTDSYNKGLRFFNINGTRSVNYKFWNYARVQRAALYLPAGENVLSFKLLPEEGTNTSLGLRRRKTIVFDVDANQAYSLKLKEVNKDDFTVQLLDNQNNVVKIKKEYSGSNIFLTQNTAFDISRSVLVHPKGSKHYKKSERHKDIFEEKDYLLKETENAQIDIRPMQEYINDKINDKKYHLIVNNTKVSRLLKKNNKHNIYIIPEISFIGLSFNNLYYHYIGFKPNPNTKYVLKIEGDVLEEDWRLKLYTHSGEEVKSTYSYYAVHADYQRDILDREVSIDRDNAPDFNAKAMYPKFNKLSKEDERFLLYRGKQSDTYAD